MLRLALLLGLGLVGLARSEGDGSWGSLRQYDHIRGDGSHDQLWYGLARGQPYQTPTADNANGLLWPVFDKRERNNVLFPALTRLVWQWTSRGGILITTIKIKTDR